MQLWLLQQLVSALLIKLDGPTVKRGLDQLIDIVEDAIESSETQADDTLLPLIATIRSALNIPDNDG